MPDNTSNDEATVVPAGIVGAAAGGSMGGALGATDLIADAEETAENDTLPGDEVTVVHDRGAAGNRTDNRGIVERIVDAVTHDDNRHIDRRSGPSI